MPHDIFEWFKENMSTDNLWNKINKTIDIMHRNKIFSTNFEKSLVLKLVYSDLMAHKSILLIEEISEITDLIPLIKLRQKRYGSPIKLVILTNIETKIYMPFLLKRFPKLFTLFDDIIASGNIHLVKPDPRFFQYSLKKYGLKPTECIYFDDQIENIKSASNLKINSFLIGKNEYTIVRKVLKKFQII